MLSIVKDRGIITEFFPGDTFPCKKILLIDDDSDFLTALGMNLEVQGYSVSTAKNSIIGWKEMDRFQRDIILIDWDMREMSGVDLVKLIKADAAHQLR